MEIKNYFDDIEKTVANAYSVANIAKKRGLDPDDKVDIPLAKNIFERVEGLIGAIKPEIIGSGVSQRLKELDTKYGSGDWRVALKIAEETADGVFCSFVDTREAIEVGTRVGLAYITMGVVSAPLEGFIEFKIKDRLDGKKYGSFYFAGPIRAAGGTAAAVTLIIGDYLRRKFGLEPFDITQDEITRTKLECETYHNMVARLQYNPKPQEFDFLLKKVPIEINGDPTSEREVLILKDLPRVGTPRIRGGMCLVLCEGLAQKAKKILKNIETWGKEFGLDEWIFLKEYIDLQKKMNATAEGLDKKEDLTHRVKPNFIYIDETVAGRPIFSYPLTKGGFRLRYGRSRLSGLAAAGISPATMAILGDFIATGSQLRIERPGKACIATPCTSIDGPILKLNDGQVIQVNTEEEALKYRSQIKEILSIGDILINYGEFLRNNHILVPSPYVEEQWVQELAKAAGSEFKIPEILDDHQMIEYSNKYNIPLHPSLLNFYNDVEVPSLVILANALSKSTISKEHNNYKIILPYDDAVKRILELICMQHKADLNYIMIDGPQALGILWAFGYLPEEKFDIAQIEKLASENKTQLEILNSVSKIKLMDKSGTYVGARLGRPEKAKQRKLKGTPHVLFPIGAQGGRLRSVNEALEKGFVETDIPVFECPTCQLKSIYPRCEKCMISNRAIKFCIRCGKETEKTNHCGTETVPYTRKNIDVRLYLDNALKKLNTSMPVLVKGVRGMSSANRIPEPLEKGILRALHDVYVNKDGTIRFDAIEAPITHFKPREIGTSIEQLKQLGYTHDIEGMPLENDNQMLELYPQDVILPDCKEWKDSSALDTIVRICAFIDELLTKYYGVDSYYNVKSMSDVVGSLIIAIAPHTSAGIIGRIIGFSKTQAFYAHPYLHSACRRNCDGDELAFIMLMDALLNFSRQYLPNKRGSRYMDLPLVLTTRIDPNEVDDEVYNMDIVDMYPLEFYAATREYKSPYDVKIKQVLSTLGTPDQYRNLLYTHPTESINAGNKVSAYKSLLAIMDKVQKQMELTGKLRAVNKSDVARILIEKHFLKDIKGNLRRYSSQEFRCLSCNTKYRRIPLIGRCNKCSGKLVLTVAEGTVSKYLEPSLDLAEKYNLPNYLKQTLDILKRKIESVFGKEATKQTGLGSFVG